MDNYGQKKASKGKSSSSGWRDQDPTLFTKVDRVKSLSWRLFLVLAGVIVGVGGPLAYRAYQNASAPTGNLQEIYSESKENQAEERARPEEKAEEPETREVAKAQPKREAPPKVAPSRTKSTRSTASTSRKSTRAPRRVSRPTPTPEIRTPEPSRRIAVVKPKPKPKARKKVAKRSKPVEKPTPAAPESTTRFVTVGPVTYSVELAKRCPRKCVLLFRNTDGTILRGKFDKSDFLRTLISADGRAQVSGTLTLEDGKPWIEPISIDALAVAKPKPKPVVAKRPVAKPRPVKRATTPEPSSSAPTSRFADRVKEAVDVEEEEQEVSNNKAGRGARSLADKIRQVSSRESDDQEDDEEVEEEKSDRPISPFQNRLRRTVNE